MPNTVPCGTPNVMFDIEELQFLIETLFMREFLIETCHYAGASSLTVWNAFESLYAYVDD